MNATEMNQTFIIAAYAITWVVILGYTLRLVRRAARAGDAFRQMGQQVGREAVQRDDGSYTLEPPRD